MTIIPLILLWLEDESACAVLQVNLGYGFAQIMK